MLIRRAVFLMLLALLACNGGTTTAAPVVTATETVTNTNTSTSASTSASTSTSTTAPKSSGVLRVLTYNVLATPLYTRLRTKAIFELLASSDADVIALQEVAEWFLAELVAQPWVSRYEMTKQNGEPFAPGGQFVLTKAPLVGMKAAVLHGRQRRTALVAEIMVGARRMAIATSHMESFLKDGAIRAQQLTDMFAMIADADDALLLGDLNFGDGEQPETAAIDKLYADLWLVLKPGDPGFTWNNEENPIAGIGKFKGEPSRRLDRILLRSTRYKPKSIHIIGNKAVGQRKLTHLDRAMIEMPENRGSTEQPMIDVFPSDHYGLSADIATQ